MSSVEHRLDQAFPEVEPGFEPLGDMVLVQLKTPRQKTTGGIILTDDTKDRKRHQSQDARVIKLGPLCFKDHRSGEDWASGHWYEPGDFVRVPLYGNDRFGVPLKDGDHAIFACVRCVDVISKITDLEAALTERRI